MFFYIHNRPPKNLLQVSFPEFRKNIQNEWKILLKNCIIVKNIKNVPTSSKGLMGTRNIKFLII